jgi:hypothetical protein
MFVWTMARKASVGQDGANIPIESNFHFVLRTGGEIMQEDGEKRPATPSPTGLQPKTILTLHANGSIQRAMKMQECTGRELL